MKRPGRKGRKGRRQVGESELQVPICLFYKWFGAQDLPTSHHITSHHAIQIHIIISLSWDSSVSFPLPGARLLWESLEVTLEACKLHLSPSPWQDSDRYAVCKVKSYYFTNYRKVMRLSYLVHMKEYCIYIRTTKASTPKFRSDSRGACKQSIGKHTINIRA